ncbi:oxidoreductase family protein [Mycobacterium sp. M26]|uniref:oxidoreductase family protein n=1 Tax=Mycobacterium sp. M26 TaxID=1762962 RepID=UPI00073F46E5|nr:oxidoreductase family protein [Mycobacterium sp. M26]
MGWFPVDPQSITPEWLGGVLGAEVRDLRIEQIGIGIGILGRLYRAHLAGTNVPPSVVVKLPTLDQQARTGMCEPLDLYRREVCFYKEIGLANPLKPATPYFVAFDEDTHDFVLVLEDLRDRRLADQTVGCSAGDAQTVIDAIAEHHAYWWDSDQFSALPWLRAYQTPPFPQVLAAAFEQRWPPFLELVGTDLSAEMRSFGDRLPVLMPWYLEQIARPPITFCHGDLRLDQLFFAVQPSDPPVTALDWQVASLARGAYDLAYFLSQSLTTETRHTCEATLIDRYRQRLAEHGIDYPANELQRDYRLTAALCFIYPVLAAGQIANDRQVDLLRVMATNAAAAIEDNDALALKPD